MKLKRFLMSFFFVTLACVVASCTPNTSSDNTSSGNTSSSNTSSSNTSSGNDDSNDISSSTSENVSDDDYFNNFKPVLRFSVASDVHIENSKTTKDDRLRQMIEVSYELAGESDIGYDNLDAILFAGDIADTGTTYEFNRFKKILDENVNDGTEVLTTLGNHEFFTSPSQTVARYLSVFEDSEEDEHKVINGFHFISVCPTDGNSYSNDKVEWLEEQIAVAEKEDMDKPIFVITHHAVLETVYGTIGANWGSNAFKNVLENHPQVVNFAGHSHFPIADPRSLHQGDFTTVNTGSLAYYELGINGLVMHDIYPTNKNGAYSTSRTSNIESGDFQIIEVDKNGSMRLIGYDLISNQKIFTRYIKYPVNSENIKTQEELAELEPVPMFLEENNVAVEKQSLKSITLSFDSAKSEGYIESYRALVYKNDKLVTKSYALACNFFFPNPDRIQMNISGLSENTEYNIEIYAVNAYGILSENYLEVTASTKSDKLENPLVFDAEFDENGCKDAVSNSYLETFGSPEVVYDEKLNRYVGNFDVGDAYVYRGIEDYYDYLNSSITIESLVNVKQFVSGDANFFSNLQAGGYGFELVGSTLSFVLNISGTYYYAKTTIKVDTWYHVVGTYDGLTMKLVVNGEVKDTVTVSGKIQLASEGTRFIGVGADSCFDGGVEHGCPSKIADAKLYFRSLTEDEIINSYNVYKDLIEEKQEEQQYPEELVDENGFKWLNGKINDKLTVGVKRDENNFYLKIHQVGSSNGEAVKVCFDVGSTDTGRRNGDWDSTLWLYGDLDWRFWHCNSDTSDSDVNIGKLSYSLADNAYDWWKAEGDSDWHVGLSYKVEKISETEVYYTLTISWEFFNKWAPVEVNSDSEIGIACRYKDEGDDWNHNGTSVDIYNPQTYVRIDKDLNTKKYSKE